jgi:UTP--glucose-1-phosphate uridylyltransferase
MPKELLPIVDTPTLQYLIDEAEASGIEQVLIILSPQKLYIKKMFDENEALNELLIKAHKLDELKKANKEVKVDIYYAVQEVMNGNGAAVYLSKMFAEGEPVAVMFGDDLMYTGNSATVTKQLIDAFEKSDKNIIGCQKTSEEVARRCGVMIAGKTDGRLTEVKGIVEKPSGELPSELVSLGRFIVKPDIYEVLENTKPGLGGEIYLTDALNALAEQGDVAAYEFEGRRYDIGNKEGYLEATVEYALRDPALNQGFSKYLKGLDLK